MRLTCPKCGAIYEIDANLIPATGRDVQCASCAHVWIQTRRGPEAPAEGEARAAGTPPEKAPPPPGEDEATEAQSEAPPSGGEESIDEPAPGEADTAAGPAVGEPDVAPEPAVGAAEAAETEEAADPADSDPAAETPVEDADAGAPRRRPDDETLRILREEAALAAAQRKARAAGNAPAPSPDVQPAAAPPAPAAARQASPVPARPDRDEARRPETPDPDPDRASEPDRKEDRDAPSGSGHRPAAEGSGDLLPDLEEINSSLSGPARRPAPAARPVAETGRRRSVGTATVLGLLVLSIAIYLAAPWIGARVPALAGILGAYAGAVEALRGWIGL